MISNHNIIIAGCLRRLLKNRFLLQKKSREWFRNIVDCQVQLSSHIEALGAHLIINESLGVAYLAPGDAELEEKIGFQLGTTLTLKKISTMILLSLTKRRLDYQNAPENEICAISRQSIKDEILPFLSHIEKYKEDRAVERELKDSIRELKELQVLFELPESEDVFEISPVCNILLPFEETQRTRAFIEAYLSQSSSIEDAPEEN
ncbi:MAG TPA: DUF4194 domain-containing protein [Pseudobdellovibrionaceae bacterium]|jgi:hypothetical protein